MAYLTQYSSSVPVIKFHIDQTLMTIGQDFAMDICIPEDGIADNHATVEAIKQAGSYCFTVKSHENESLIEINGVAVSQTALHDGDWLIIGGVEFQFTDDGVNEIKETNTVSAAPASAVVEEFKPKQAAKESEALTLIKELNNEVKSMSTKEFIANSRGSRRRLNI